MMCVTRPNTQDIPNCPLALLRRTSGVDLDHPRPGKERLEEAASQAPLKVTFHQKMLIEVTVCFQYGQRLLAVQLPYSLLLIRIAR